MEEFAFPPTLPKTAALAFLGDAVCHAYVRELLVLRGIPKAGDLSRLSLLYVTAENQATAYRAVLPHLTEAERELAHRASNAHKLSRPRHASVTDYRLATGWEALLGAHRYMKNEERLRFLLDTAYRAVTEALFQETMNETPRKERL
jgi:ribonuclease-3 family protein